MALKQVEDAYNERARNERRINPHADKSENKLKNIAGLIQKLSYKEMRKLGDMLEASVRHGAPNDYPSILLEIADEILAEGESMAPRELFGSSTGGKFRS